MLQKLVIGEKWIAFSRRATEPLSAVVLSGFLSRHGDEKTWPKTKERTA